MCQGSCSTNTCQQTCSPVEAQLHTALAEIQTLAQQQQLQALNALPRNDGQPAPAAFAMQLIIAKATTALDATLAPAPDAAKPVTLHRGRSGLLAGCGCPSTADFTSKLMDQTAGLLYMNHAQHRRAA
jgi:DsbC/DsbD-like thiol-disulfide interchange protein